jgi:hypothetical protein
MMLPHSGLPMDGWSLVEAERKSIQATIDSITAPTDEKPYGGFIAIASDESLDRDGEHLLKSEWVTPLPDRITIDMDHGMSVATTIGSAHPYFEGGRLMIDASFSSIERAQETRALVLEGHITTVSVAALVDRSKESGTPRRELLNVGIVAIPSNRNAVILDAKAGVKAPGLAAFQAAVKSIVEGKSADAAMLQAIHDASSHLGADCVDGIVGLDDDLSEDGESGESDGANKCAALALRMKALRR